MPNKTDLRSHLMVQSEKVKKYKQITYYIGHRQAKATPERIDHGKAEFRAKFYFMRDRIMSRMRLSPILDFPSSPRTCSSHIYHQSRGSYIKFESDV